MVADLDHIIGSILKVRVLRSLAGLQKPVSGRQAGRLAAVSSKVLSALDELTAVGIVSRTESTGQHLYSLNRDHYLSRPLVALFRAEEEKLSHVSAKLKHALESEAGVITGAIFGSVARGRTHPDSDLDILIIIEPTADTRRIRDRVLDEADELATAYGSKLSPVLMSEPQWLKLVKAKDPFTLSAASDARVFLGPGLMELGRHEQKGKKKARRRG
jgi:predicted nucleotidyltransferase